MIHLQLPLILASGSPRRKEILDAMQLSYTVDVSQADESFVAKPREMVMELSKRKALAVAQRHPDAIILAADTIVFADEVLGKPRDAEHACCMLEKLSGNWHSVFSGLTLINTHTGKILQDADETRVHFCPLSRKEIVEYVSAGEERGQGHTFTGDTGKMMKAGWMDENGRWKTHNGCRPECFDKAGAYAIQGTAGMFIDRIEGSYSNVVGLPMATLRALLNQIE